MEFLTLCKFLSKWQPNNKSSNSSPVNPLPWPGFREIRKNSDARLTKSLPAKVVEDALAKGIQNIWIQQSSDTPEALALLQGKDVNLITKQCILMHYQPDSFHKFHRNIKRFFGGLPR
ncbi:MAG: hypothetical protein D4R64_07335 [Porphyromonadaceae bacterium]|nr:MAG: hypothetical protein D4R64_07335 [Porphyromonadaceae bacterium]